MWYITVDFKNAPLGRGSHEICFGKMCIISSARRHLRDFQLLPVDTNKKNARLHAHFETLDHLMCGHISQVFGGCMWLSLSTPFARYLVRLGQTLVRVLVYCDVIANLENYITSKILVFQTSKRQA